MKRIAACCLVLLLLSATCRKNAVPSPLIGQWEIRSAQQGMTPTIVYSPGNDSLLEFSSSNFYAMYIKGRLIRTGSYTVVEDHSFDALVVPAGQFTQRIVYADSTAKIFFQINSDTLTFVSGNFAVDGGTKLQYKQVAK
jgi:hypothetical protein